jgi:hypothetical protein
MYVMPFSVAQKNLVREREEGRKREREKKRVSQGIIWGKN